VTKGALGWAIFAALVFGAFLPAEVSAQVPAPDSADYLGASWNTFFYPGLSQICLNPRIGSGILIGKVAYVRVSHRSDPLAVVVAGCNLNHFYASVYVFEPGHTSNSPQLLQRLSMYQGTEQFGSLTTSRNRINLRVFGNFTRGLCCPSITTLRRWTWDGHQFSGPQILERKPVPYP
jgi:hypothetical protein